VAGSCEFGDEPAGSGVTELVTQRKKRIELLTFFVII
jgi:hypothetical protein